MHAVVLILYSHDRRDSTHVLVLPGHDAHGVPPLFEQPVLLYRPAGHGVQVLHRMEDEVPVYPTHFVVA